MSTRPLITKPYDLTNYNEDFTEGYLYLSYVHLRGYMLITYKAGNIWFTPLEINLNPNEFGFKLPHDWREEEETLTDEYKTLLNEVMKVFKPYEKILKDRGLEPHKVRETIQELSYNFILDKLDELDNLGIDNHFTSLEDYKNPQIKKFILDPNNEFTKWLDKPSLSPQDKKEKDREVKLEIANKVDDLISFVNENRGIYASDDLVTRELGRLTKELAPSPLLNLHKGKSIVFNTNYGSEEIVKEFGVKRYLDNSSKPKYYIYNKDLRYFEEVTKEHLKNMIYKRYGFNLNDSHVNELLKGVSTEDKLYKNLLVLNNLYYDIDYLEPFKPLTFDYRRQDYLTVNTIGVFNESTNNIKLLNYDLDLDIRDIFSIKDLSQIDPKTPLKDFSKKYGMTFTEYILRLVLIPKEYPQDITLFIDYLERLGSDIKGRNTEKVITFYYGEGDNGKSILNLFYDLIYNKLNLPLRPDNLNDQFNLKMFDNRLVINIDEITANTFDDLKDWLKNITSKYSKQEAREMYSQNTFTLYGFPNINIYSNVLIDLDLQEDLALFSRIDYLKLPNRFVTPKELDKYNNAYPIIQNLEEILKHDIEGLSWLITAGIMSYKHMLLEGRSYLKKQTREETIDIFKNVDYLTKFLMIYTKYDEDLERVNYVSGQELIGAFTNYMELQGKSVTQNKTKLSKTLGLKIKGVYPNFNPKTDKYKKEGRLTYYKLKLKSTDEVNREFRQVYKVNDDNLTDRQVKVLHNLSNDLYLVYKAIKEGYNTLNKLNSKYPDNDNIDKVKQLLTLNIIVNTNTASLEDSYKVT